MGRETVGSAPIRILDENGDEVPDGQPGELFSCNPYTFEGYWRLPEKTAEAFRGDYCSVGDMALRDSEGFIRLIDRKKNMIISGGENVYPSEVETVLGAHPASWMSPSSACLTRPGERLSMPSSCGTPARA